MKPISHVAPETDAHSSRVSAILIDWLAANDQPTDRDLAELCARHPEDAEELAKGWRQMQEILGHIPKIEPRAAASYSMLLRGFGSPQPNISLKVDADTAGTTADLLRRLTARGPTTDRYVTRDVIDGGGMGYIQVIWDDDLQRQLVRKVPKIRAEDNSWKRAWKLSRFLQEAQITSQLNHPGILPVYDLGLDADGKAFYTMPLIRGETLDHVFAQYRAGNPEWRLTRCLNVLIKVCEALAFAHSLGVVHRDVKPGNVMVGSFGEAYVMDWGLSRVIGQPDLHDTRMASAVRSSRTAERHLSGSSPLATSDGQVIGTPAYMAPEQAMGKIDDIGQRTDIYSVGAMLYHLLSGTMPYESMCETKTAHSILTLVREGPPKALLELSPGTPRALAAICSKAMARDPNDRYDNAQAMARQIEAFLDDRPTENATGWEILRLAIRRNCALAATTTVSVAVILVGLLAFILFQDQTAARRRRISDFMAAKALIDQVESTYPIRADSIPRMGIWLQRAKDLLSREASYSKEAKLGLVTYPPVGSERKQMLALMETVRGIVPALSSDQSAARQLHKLSIEDHQDEWKHAREEISKSSIYGGRVHLQPQLGLVPLRPDPTTGYWEFWMPLTGKKPEFDPGKSGYKLTPESSLVLVLLPGDDEFWIGSAEKDRDKIVGGWPRTKRSVAPFFIGKYEVPQSVWKRVMRTNPSFYKVGATMVLPPPPTWLDPVESISRYDAYRFAHRLLLQLPSEAQWEYAARAGTTTAYWNGDDPRTGLYQCENIRDQAAIDDQPTAPASSAADWNDGFRRAAPIGSFRPNGFGLYDTLGNVAEWTSAPWTITYEPNPPASAPPDFDGECVVRGGHFYQEARFCRCEFRFALYATNRFNQVGMRVARKLDPAK